MIKLKAKLIGTALGILMILAFLAEVFRRGASHERNEFRKDRIEKDTEGRNAVLKEQTETDGLSSGDLVERMRRRDGDWSGM